MPSSMKRESILTARAAVVLVAGLTALASSAGAQAPVAARRIGEEIWRVTASTGAYVPRSALIIGADGKDTRLGAGPSFSIDVQYLISEYAAGYANGTLGFNSITLGTAIRPTTTGPITLGTDFTITAQLRDAAGAAAPLAGVTLTIAIDTGGGTLNGTLTATTDAAGSATFTVNVTGAVGARTIIVTGTGLTSATTAAITFN